MLKYWTPIPVKFSHLITDCTNEIQSQILMIFLLLLYLFFSFLADFLMWTRVAFPTTQFSAGCFRGRPLTLTFSAARICLSTTAWPPCDSFSNTEFLWQPAELHRPQKYLSQCTTEIERPSAKGRPYINVCVLQAWGQSVWGQSIWPFLMTILETFKNKKIMAKDEGLENTKFIVQNELSLLYFLFNYLCFSLFIQHGFYRNHLHTWCSALC